MEKISYISVMSNKVKMNGGINLAQGIPGFSPPAELIHILSRISSDNIHQYAPANGNIELVRTIKEKFRSATQDNIMVVNGATEAISLIFTYINGIMPKKRTVLGFDPAYESFPRLPGIFGRKYISFSLEEDFSVDFGNLEKTVSEDQVGLIFVNSPGNPYGKIWTEKEFLKLKDIAEKHKVYVIADCVYSEIYFGKKPFTPLFDSQYYFYVNSFSKLLSITGWRIGYFIASKEHISEIRLIHDYTGLCSPSVLQEAVARYLNRYDFGKKYAADLRKKMKNSFILLKGILEECGFKVPKIEGGYFIWAELPACFDDGFKFVMDLYEKKKVAAVPGIHFSDSGKKFVRFNIARPEDEIVEAGKRISAFIRERQK
ncbi:MAG TPA: pyridoxal phosphate-dependent aminotransferase [Clostridiales bacterium]|nr:pyridoxal phosphate-dependent aminotransferase [Clostridiales bacterium]